MQPFNVVKTEVDNCNSKFGFCMQLFINRTEEKNLKSKFKLNHDMLTQSFNKKN